MTSQANNHLQNVLFIKRKGVFQVPARLLSASRQGFIKNKVTTNYNRNESFGLVQKQENYCIDLCNTINLSGIKPLENSGYHKVKTRSNFRKNGEKVINKSTFSCNKSSEFNYTPIFKYFQVLGNDQHFLFKTLVMWTKTQLFHTSLLRTGQLSESNSTDLRFNTKKYIRSVLISIPSRDSSISATVATKSNYGKCLDMEPKYSEDKEFLTRNQNNVRNSISSELQDQNSRVTCSHGDGFKIQNYQKNMNNEQFATQPSNENLKKGNNVEKDVPSDNIQNKVKLISNKGHNKSLTMNIAELPKEYSFGDKGLKQICNFQELVDQIESKMNTNKNEDKFSNIQKRQLHFYKGPLILGKDLKSITKITKATFDSCPYNMEKDEEIRKNSIPTNLTEAYPSKNVPNRESHQQTSVKDSINSEKIESILKEHKILLETLLDKISLHGTYNKLYRKQCKYDKNKTQFEQMKYKILKQIWKSYFEDQEKINEKVPRVTSSKIRPSQSESISKKYSKTFIDNLTMVNNSDLGFSLNTKRDITMVGTQIGDTQEVTNHLKGAWKPICMTSPSKRKHVNASDSNLGDIKRNDIYIDEEVLKKSTPKMQKFAKPIKKNQNQVMNLNREQRLIKTVPPVTNLQNTINSFKTKKGSIRTLSYSCSSYNTRNKYSKDKYYPKKIQLSKNSMIRKQSKTLNCEKVSNKSDLRINTTKFSENKIQKSHYPEMHLEHSNHILFNNSKREYHRSPPALMLSNNNYQLSDRDSKLLKELKSMKELKAKIMLKRAELQKEEELSKYSLNTRSKYDQFFNSEYSNYTVRGPGQNRSEYNMERTWKPNYPKTKLQISSQSEQWINKSELEYNTSEFKMTSRADRQNSTPDFSILKSSALPVPSYTFNRDRKRRNWSMVSPVPYLNNFLEFRKKKQLKQLNVVHTDSQKSKEQVLSSNRTGPYNNTNTKKYLISNMNKVKEVRATKQYLGSTHNYGPYPIPPDDNFNPPKMIHTEQAQLPPLKRNWTTLSPVTFVDNVFWFKKQVNSKQKQNYSEDNETENCKTRTNTVQHDKFNSRYYKGN